MKKERTIQCAGCKNIVTGYFGAMRKFCTNECKKLHGGKSVPAIRSLQCAGCGETFIGRIRKQRIFCGLECRKKYGFRPNPKKSVIELCKICSSHVEVKLSQKKNNKSGFFFCCHEHANEWQRRNKIGGTCETCGKSFLRSPSFIKRGLNKFCSNKCRYKSPAFAEQILAMNVNQQKKDSNKLEKAGYKLLDDLGIEYYPQYVISNKFCVDAFVPELNVIIQFDGDYWHGNSEKFEVLSKRQEKRVKLDRSQDKYFHKIGFVVIRIWESEFKKNIKSVEKRIKNTISERCAANKIT